MNYKKFLNIILAFVFVFSSIFAQQDKNDKNLFLDAARQYKEGNFQSALQLYQKIEDKTPQINYNLGNCAYKLDKLGYALLYWRRAEKSWGIFGRSELLDNIFLLKKTLNKEKIKPVKYFGWFVRFKNSFVSLVRCVPLFLIQFSFLILWLFLFVCLRFLYKKKRRCNANYY